MVRPSKKKENGSAHKPEADERKRLKKLAFSKSILSETPSKPLNYVSLSPSKTVIKHHGKDIIKKSHRKNRFLFSFPGLLAPLSGGKVGELKDLGTKNPILYLDFPKGQMKLFGTIIYPQNRYLTLQFSKGGKNVICEDCFDTMIVFSDAWWIGTKDENPDEARLEFPKEFTEGQSAEWDFKGGAGATAEIKSTTNKCEGRHVAEEHPETDEEDYLSESENTEKGLPKATPTRHSERTAGKAFKFTETSPDNDSLESGAESPKEENVKKEQSDIEISPAPKVYGRKSQESSSKRKLSQVDEPRKRGKAMNEKVTGIKVKTSKKQVEVEDDNEEFSSPSQDVDGSDEDWVGDF